MSRLEELRAGLEAVEQRIVTACSAADRRREDVTLIVVTKTYPASDVELLHQLGVRDVGENRHPEAGRKRTELGDVGTDLRWHFVGGLQSNKAHQVAGYADLVHSVDRSSLIGKLGSGARSTEREIGCFVQVNLEGGDPAAGGRAGCSADQVPALADEIAGTDGLRLSGVMTVAPLDADPVVAFAELRALSADLVGKHPTATAISAGMSDDLEAAVAAGATHVRIGRSVLGERTSLR